jgi:hypothetical protein
VYQVFVKLAEPRSSSVAGPLSFPSAEERAEYVKGPAVFWYHYAEEDDWMLWLRGGAWAATQTQGKADIVPEPPEITEDDRW